MRLGIKELRRRPGRFLATLSSLTLLAILLLVLAALLDGLFLGQTGAYRAQDADLVAFSKDSKRALDRSRIPSETRIEIEKIRGVDRTGGLGQVAAVADVDGEQVDVVVFGYELATGALPEPPPPGSAYADRTLEENGLAVGDVVGLGSESVEISGFVDDTAFAIRGTLWVEPSTWRSVLRAAQPNSALGGGDFQALLIEVEGASSGQVQTALAVDEEVDAVTLEQAISAIPGVTEQTSVFGALIGTTVFVTGLVVALFFALVTIERIPLFGVLKAIGASSLQIWSLLLAQAVALVMLAFGIAWLIVWAASPLVPEEIPVRFEIGRAWLIGSLLFLTACFGSAITIRRVSRIDPVSAVGG